MFNSNSALKLNPKIGEEKGLNYISSLSTESLKKNLLNPTTLLKEKVYRKVVTETNEEDVDINDKKSKEGIRFLNKGGSTDQRKNMVVQVISPSSKLCFNNAGRMKRIKKPGFGSRAATQTGPIIQNTINNQSQFPIQRQKNLDLLNNKKDCFQFETKKDNKYVKNILESKSGNIFSKIRMQTQGNAQIIDYSNSEELDLIQIIGQGTFGTVFKGKMKKTGEIVAVKKVFQDPKYKNRQVQIINMLRGQFLMKVLGKFATFQENGQFLNIVMTCYDGDLHGLIRSTGKRGLSTRDIKVISYQIFRGLMFIHQLKIAHRDIKPHNILYKGKKVALCDFGSAKILTNQPNLPYICSRCYRAPELIFGATNYTTAIDIWSVGCIIVEMIQGTPIFIGDTTVDHLIQIIKVLGTPTKTQVIEMNPKYNLDDYKFPRVKKRQWKQIFPKADPLLIDLITQLMVYNPKQRFTAAQALAHKFYDQLRDEQIYKQLGKQYGLPLFNFSRQESRGNEHLMHKLIPSWYKQHKG